MTPIRIQRQRTKGWRMPAGAVYVGRRSGWENPFPVGHELALHVLPKHPEVTAWACTMPITPALSVDLYRAWALARPAFVDEVRDGLAGRVLACWCPLDAPCHADVLLELANGGAS